MKKKIGDLTIRELVSKVMCMDVPSDVCNHLDCGDCMVNNDDVCFDLEEEIEVQE